MKMQFFGPANVIVPRGADKASHCQYVPCAPGSVRLVSCRKNRVKHLASCASVVCKTLTLLKNNFTFLLANLIFSD
jgi:hypothetical protein